MFNVLESCMLRKYNILLIVALLFTSSFANAQKMLGYVEVYGVIKDGIRPLENVHVEVYANNTLLKIELAEITGDFSFVLELNRKYKIKFTKQFYVSKFVEFDTHVLENELGLWSFNFVVELFPAVPMLDFGFLDAEPVGKIQYNKNYGEFDHLTEYTESMQQKIAHLLANYNATRNQYYQSLIVSADKLYRNGQVIPALNEYRKCDMLDRKNEYPQKQIAKIDKQLRNTEKKYSEYINLMRSADSLYGVHEFSQSKAHYNLALGIFSESAYAHYMIAKIDSLSPLFDASYIRLQQYRGFLNKADLLVGEAKYIEAIGFYNKALSIQPNDTYASRQISYLRGVLAKRESQTDKRKRYLEYVNLGDRYFQTNSLSAARLVYLKALQIFPEDTYSQVQIEKIDMILYPDKVSSSNKKFPSFTKFKRDKEFLNSLIEQYAVGKTVEYFDLPGKKIKRVIFNENNIATEYIEVRYDFGTFFFRNGQNISRAIFISETNR